VKKLVLLLSALLILTVPAYAQADGQQPIRVGSKLFTEDVLLGHIVYVALEEAGYPVVDMISTGNTNASRNALLNNLINIYPEYTGTALTVFFDSSLIGELDAIDSETVYAVVGSSDSAYNDLIWLAPAPINNSYVLVITQEFADANNIHSLTDFAGYVNGGGDVTFAAGEEFVTRPDGLQAMEQAYGFDLMGSQMIVITDATPTMLVEALSTGVNNINVALATGASSLIYEYNLVPLNDEQQLLLPYAPAPVIRGTLLRRNPEIVTLLNPIFRTLDEETLVNLVAQVEVFGKTPRQVATDYLAELKAEWLEAERLAAEQAAVDQANSAAEQP